LAGYYGAVGKGRSSYGYASDGTIYLECEISPEEDPTTELPFEFMGMEK